MAKFQLLLPTLEVEEVSGEWELERLAEDIKHFARDFTIDGFDGDLVGTLAGAWELVVKQGEGLVLRSTHGLGGAPEEVKLTPLYRVCYVTSSNGKRYVSTDLDPTDGWFGGVPAALLQPERGEVVEDRSFV